MYHCATATRRTGAIVTSCVDSRDRAKLTQRKIAGSAVVGLGDFILEMLGLVELG